MRSLNRLLQGAASGLRLWHACSAGGIGHGPVYLQQLEQSSLIHEGAAYVPTPIACRVVSSGIHDVIIRRARFHVGTLLTDRLREEPEEIGRASCREREKVTVDSGALGQK